MLETLDKLLKLTMVIFRVGNLLDMGLRLKMKDAFVGLRNVRFVSLSIIWGFILCPALAYVLTRIIPLDPFYGGLPPAQKSVISLGMATRNLGAAFAPLFAIPHVDHRAIVMVALGVPMQTVFSLLTAIWLGRHEAGKPQTLHEKTGAAA